jgi:hypothetical protein
MSWVRRTAVVTLLAGGAALVSAAPTLAAERFASPTGSGTACTQAAPCDIQFAVEATGPPNPVADLDVVTLLPGTYTAGTTSNDTLFIVNAITVRGAPGQPVPVLNSGAANGAVLVNNSGATLRRLEIVHNHVPNPIISGALVMASGTAEQILAREGATASSSYGCQLSVNGAGAPLLRDSICASSGGWGLIVTRAVAGANAAHLRNVTAIAAGAGGYGLYTNTNGAGTSLSVKAANVIADGTAFDVYAETNGGSTTTVNLDYSNYGSLAMGVGATVPAVGSGTNQDSNVFPPAFVNAAAGDFRQAAGSPTIDHGVAGVINATDLGPADFEGQARNQGAAPDIGGDEFDLTPPPDTSPPDTTMTRRPRNTVKTRRAKKRVRYAFRSSEAGSTFRCKLDGRPPRPCTSPWRPKVAIGRHTVEVVATDPSGNADPSPAVDRFKVKHKG